MIQIQIQSLIRTLFCILSCILVIEFCLSRVMSGQQVIYPPYPAGMRVLAGNDGTLVRMSPSLNSGCGSDNHACTIKDVVPAQTVGTIQSDPPVFESAGWYWVRVTFDTNVTGWASGYPPYLIQSNPPTMTLGSKFTVLADYDGAVIDSANCIQDGVNSTGELSLQSNGLAATGTIKCPTPPSNTGNHIVVVSPTNKNGTSKSTEFQYSVVNIPTQSSPPAQPLNLRIQ